jgi:hypothetical protein
MPGDLRTDLGHDPHHLVTDGQRIGLRPPLATHGVDVGMTNSRVMQFDQHIVGTDVAASDGSS